MLSCIAQVVLAEQWCVRREMREGFTVDPVAGGRGRPDDLELAVVGHKRGGGSIYDRIPLMEDA